MKKYSVKKIAKLAKVSIRTLHHYDKIGLLTPESRSKAGYRSYGEKELYLLQQILFYKELGFSLNEVKRLLSLPEFDLIESLKSHKKELNNRKKQIDVLLSTIDKTVAKLTKGEEMKHEDLYKGFSKDQATAYRNEAVAKWGEEVEKSEEYLMGLGKSKFAKLHQEFNELWKALSEMVNDNPKSVAVQEKIHRHYNMIKMFWGISQIEEIEKEKYLGLGELYRTDDRYTKIDGKEIPGFGEFLYQAMKYYSDKNLD